MKEMITINEGQVVTSSRRVAEDFGKRHDNVLSDIRVLLSNLVPENSGANSMFFETTYENRGKQYPEYLMNRDGFSMLVMGFNGKKAAQWKLKYIQAFNDMEKKMLISHQFQIPQTLPEALLLAYELSKTVEEQTKLLEEQAPVVEEYKAFVDTTNAFPMVKAVKAINISGLGRNKLMKLLREEGILTQDNYPKQQFQDAGYFCVKEYLRGDKVIFTPLVYQRGLSYIFKIVKKSKYWKAEGETNV